MFAKRFPAMPDLREIEARGLIDAGDEHFGFAVADVTLRELHGLLAFKGLGAEVRGIASASPIVRSEEALPEGRRVARALRALAEATAKLPNSTLDHLIMADAAVFAALAVEHAPNLDATLAHATRYLSEVGGVASSWMTSHAERLARTLFQRPPDGRIPYDERRRALAYAVPGTPAGQLEADLTEGGRWSVVTSSPTELRLRHHAGVELVARLEDGRVVSREILHDEPTTPGGG